MAAAKYEASGGTPAVLDASGITITPAVGPTTAAWVALAPHDTESMGMTYQQRRGLDFGIFGKRIGSRWNDISSDHQNVPLEPFWMSNLFLNYNIRGRSIFDGSKIKLSINNLFDDHSIVAISAANDGTTLTSTTVNNALKVTQNQQLYSPSWADSLENAVWPRDHDLLPDRPHPPRALINSTTQSWPKAKAFRRTLAGRPFPFLPLSS